jgi:hypothetical protein
MMVLRTERFVVRFVVWMAVWRLVRGAASLVRACPVEEADAAER